MRLLVHDTQHQKSEKGLSRLAIIANNEIRTRILYLPHIHISFLCFSKCDFEFTILALSQQERNGSG